MMQIDRKKYKITDDNHYKTKNAKTQIIISFSLRKDNYHIKRLQHKDFGKTKKWNTYTITRNGKIFQHYPDKHHTDFIGVKEGDKKSISIVLENMGCVFKTPNDEYINWLNESCDGEFVVEKKWLGYNYWENIPDNQFSSLVDLCNKICDSYHIPKKCVEFQHHHKDIMKYNGIVFKSNYIEDSSDINPMFNIDRFNNLLINEKK